MDKNLHFVLNSGDLKFRYVLKYKCYSVQFQPVRMDGFLMWERKAASVITFNLNELFTSSIVYLSYYYITEGLGKTILLFSNFIKECFIICLQFHGPCGLLTR